MEELTKNTLYDFFSVPTHNIDYRGKLNDEQYRAVTTTEGPVLIIAGAGSGKTTVLTYRLAYLIEKGISPDRILLLTFTNKAANEMIQRALAMLGADCRLSGSTFHSFCAKTLRQFSGAAGLSPDFLIKDSNEEADILDYVKELEGLSKEKDFPNGSQLTTMFSTSVNKGMPLEDVVNSFLKGKFKDYISDIKRMHTAYTDYKEERNMLDYDDLLLRTNKMLRENEGVRRKLSDIYEYIMVDEYQDSNALQFELISLLRSFENKNICVVGDDQQCVISGTPISVMGGELPVDVISPSDRIAVASGHGEMKHVNPDEVTSRQYDGYVYEITTKFGRKVTVTGEHVMFADDGKRPETVHNADFYLFGGNLSDSEWQHKMVVDDDSLRKQLESQEAETMHETMANIEKILLGTSGVTHDRYAVVTKGRQFKFMLAKDIKKGMIVPAYRQDTGNVIGDIVSSVEKKPYSGKVYDINVDYYMNFIAGGICMHNCIYGFRGADYRNILNFPSQFEPCQMIVLFRNYRSNQEILDFTNKVAMDAKYRFDKELLGTHHSGHLPEVIHVEDDQTQARAVLYDIINRHNDGTPLKDMAVLIRSAKDSNFLETMIASCAGRYPVPYRKFGGIKFLEQAHIRDILAFLKVTVNEKEEVSWFRIFQLYPNIGPVYGRRLVNGINSFGISYLLDNKHTGKKYGEYLPEIYKWYNEVKQLELYEQLEKIINEYYYNARKATIDAKKSKGSVISSDRKKLDDDTMESQALLDMCKAYKTANSFLNDLTLDANVNGDDTEDFLTISTVHSAKGLEFDTVYLLSCIDGVFPWGCSTEEEMEEERRVFYVATTRAKENLKMYSPNYVYKYGKVDKAECSIFLDGTENLCKSYKIS